MRSQVETTDVNELRQRYLQFFQGKGHLIYPSASLKSNDPGLLFNVAGMQQFKPYFQGETPRLPGAQGVHRRVVTSQKCLRAGGKDSDIENVGRTRRHHTFFEMLGNFSFGDYFKREAITWAWEFLTSSEWLGLEPERLYVTVFFDDDEAYAIWREVGIPEARLSRWGEAENFWPANAISDEREGPCGPCSEIFYDRGPNYGSEDETGPNTGSGDRFVEIWNLVFTQFNLKGGELTPLPQKNIDTGSGLERIAAVVTGAPDAYATSLFEPIIRRLVKLSGIPYQDIESVHHRIIADHLRAVTFAICDGIPPANDGAGYVIKMLIRRASRQAYLLGLQEPMLYKLVGGVVEAMGAAYPELKGAQPHIESVIKGEEEQFLHTLESGTARLGRLLDELEGDTLPGEVAFDLWETYGFPLDLTGDMAAERGLKVDKKGFEAARQQARERSRGAQERAALFTGENSALSEIAREHGESEFLGYHTLEADAEVVALLSEGGRVPEVAEGERAQVILERTPFYAEGGGQVGDSGVLEWPGGKALISTTSKRGGLYLHQARVLRGRLGVGQQVRAVVDPSRLETEKHHSATHLLHAALRSVLGTHVAQAGSLVAPERLRFDFSHSHPLTTEEIVKVETLVNRWIQADFEVNWRVVPIAEAKAQGAMMLFGEKYGEQVRLVRMGDGARDVSRELCGGTHVRRTGEIGSLIITAEEAVSAGVRRIEALCGMAALRHHEALRAELGDAARALGAQADELTKRAEKLQAELKAAQKETAGLRDKLAAAQTSSSTATQVQEAAGFHYAVSVLEGLDAAALRSAADALLQRSGADLVVLASGALLVVKVGKEAQARSVHAGNFIGKLAERAGGSGGGRSDMAQAGVKDALRLPEALAAIPEILERLDH